MSLTPKASLWNAVRWQIQVTSIRTMFSSVDKVVIIHTQKKPIAQIIFKKSIIIGFLRTAAEERLNGMAQPMNFFSNWEWLVFIILSWTIAGCVFSHSKPISFSLSTLSWLSNSSGCLDQRLWSTPQRTFSIFCYSKCGSWTRSITDAPQACWITICVFDKIPKGLISLFIISLQFLFSSYT